MPEPEAADRGGHHTGGASAFALEGHTHETPALPRWVRYLAAVTCVLALVVGGLSLIVLRQDARLDEFAAYIDSRSDARDAERKADLELQRLLLCDLLLAMPGSPSPGRQLFLDRLACPPPGDPAYADLPPPVADRPPALDVPATPAPSALETTPAPRTGPPVADSTTAPTPTTEAGRSLEPRSPPATSPPPAPPPEEDRLLPVPLCVPLLGCLIV